MNKINRQIIDELEYTHLSKENISLENFPDFLILGPQRTGTTWLSENLRVHPQVFLTNPKEIFFFNKLQFPHHPRYQSNDLAWYLNFFNESPKEYIKKNVTMLKRYGELYKPKVRGEATASYAALPKEIIKEVVTLNPDIKGILMVRNPIMRAWAHAKKDLLNKSSFSQRSYRELTEVSDQEFEEFFYNSYQVKCGSYSLIIENWSCFLKEGNLFVGFFDDISNKPKELLLQVFDFLGIRSKDKYIGSLSEKPIAATDASSNLRKLPHKYRMILEEIFRDEMMNLEQRFGRNFIR